MRAHLPQREPDRIAGWERNRIYEKVIEKTAKLPRFIMHDGPPYANGHIHSGTVLNKILKDFVVKYRNMTGFHCEYIPGWDCHGLPIENKVEQELGCNKDQLNIAEFRKLCREYALRFVDIQRDEFKRLGVLGDWDNPYLTLHHSYEATIAREFGKVVGAGAIYKSKKPVLWCAHHETALAEAEVEYEDLTSPSIWVTFAMNDSARERLSMLPAGKSAQVVIWTTTPWTLPANLAITLHPTLEYSLVDVGDTVYFVAAERVKAFTDACGIDSYEIAGIVRGAAMEGASCRHPFVDRDSLLILGDFVTTESGSGCVHTAPGHGADDFVVGRKYGLEAYAPVDDKGCFTEEVPEYAGRKVFDTDADIVEMLRAKGVLLNSKRFTHSYPVCQRCKNPIVFRATSQWFIAMEKTGLRDKAIEAIPTVEWIPAKGQQRIGSMVETRPDWCLSRQRLWGVPIIAFYCTKCNHTLVEQSLVDHVADIFAEEGADAWFHREVRDLLPAGTLCPECGHDDFTRENDIVDVWFESGVSYAAVIEARYGEGTISDLYLEGSDQHRGWFQSSLLESVLTRGRPPYVAVLTHGFVVDGDGRKVSKTLGNYIPPEEIIKKGGAEIYRLWTAAENYQEDVRISDEVLKTLIDAYMKIRNTFRFLLGNLDDFNPSTDLVKFEDMLPLDRFMMHRTGKLVERVIRAYEAYRFHEIYQSVVQFCAVDLSAFYLDVLKDRLYVLPLYSTARRSARTALYEIISSLVRVLAPILSFTCDEVWEYLPHHRDDPESVFLTRFSQYLQSRFIDKELAGDFDNLLLVREQVNKAMEAKRVTREIGHSLDARVGLRVGREHFAADAVRTYGSLLGELLIVSSIDVIDEDGEGLEIDVSHAPGEKCQRCWHWSETVGASEEFPGTCSRCAEILTKLKVRNA
jgi:isoleucyl-tRNA synthetase